MATVTLFEGRNFEGASVELGEGSTRFPSPELFNDRATSIKVTPGYCAVLYEHANENGGYGLCVDLLEDCPDLSVYGFDKTTSYVRVFAADRGVHVWARGRNGDAGFVPGHWERKRATPTATPAVAVVGPPVPAPTQPEPSSQGVQVRDHRGEEPLRPPPETPPGGWDGVVRDHRKSKLKHLFVLMLENRSFDHMLGHSGITGTDAGTGQPTQIDGLNGTQTNTHDGVAYAPAHGAPDRSTFDPGHGFPAVLEQLCGAGARYERGAPYPPVNNSGFASNYGRSHPEDPGGAMRCFTPDQVPVITALAKEFVVCDRWFCSMPGPTEPNRWFVHAGTAGDFDNSPTSAEIAESMFNPWGGFEFANGTVFNLLKKAGVKYRIYACDEFPNVAELDGVSRTFDVDDFEDFAGDVSSPSYDAAYTFIEPSYDVFREYKGGNSQHPLGSAKAGEMLIKQTYEAIRRSPHWESSMLIVLYDEHGGFYDHVAPPPARATGSIGRAYGFAFDQLGPRIPAIVVSPLIPRNLIDHRTYEHSSVIATLTSMFGLGGLTPRTATSSDLKHLAILDAPRQDTPLTLPDPMAGIMARTIKVRVADQVAERPAALLSDDPTGSAAMVIRSALAQHLEVTPAAAHPAIFARVRALKTHAEALEYLKEVAALVQKARTAAGVRPSPVVRRREDLLVVS